MGSVTNIQGNNEQTLKNQNEIYTEILKSQSGGVIAAEYGGSEVLMVNQAALRMFGFDCVSQIENRIAPLWERMEMVNKEQVFQRLRELNGTQEVVQFEFRVRTPCGQSRYMLDRAKLVHLANGSAVVVHAITEITEQKRLERELITLSETDAMTGIRNRGSGEEQIQRLLRRSQSGLFVIFDVDKFKQINDNYGHSVGDRVIIAAANQLRQTFHQNDIVMRLGGDEFAAFLVGVTDPEEIRNCMERLIEAVSAIQIRSMPEHTIRISIGCKVCPAEREFSFDDVYRAADRALYRSKERGGGCYSVADEEKEPE